MFVTNSATVACCGEAPESCKCGKHSHQIENSSESSLVTNELNWAEFYSKTPEERAEEEAAARARDAKRAMVSNAADPEWDADDDSKPAGGSLAAVTPPWVYDPAKTGR